MIGKGKQQNIEICSQQKESAGLSPSDFTSDIIVTTLSSSGSVPKWSNGPGCKPGVSDFGGSNPSRPTIRLAIRYSDCSLMVNHEKNLHARRWKANLSATSESKLPLRDFFLLFKSPRGLWSRGVMYAMIYILMNSRSAKGRPDMYVVRS